MTALNAERRTLRYGQEPSPALWNVKMKGGVKAYAGGLAAIEAGYATPGRAATTLFGFGRFEATVDNTAGSSGDLSVDILSGVFKWANSTSSDQITQADLGAYAYIVDDQTVAKTNGSSSRSKAGRIVGVDTDGVWVLMGWLAGQ
jgi:hypothetical protein